MRRNTCKCLLFEEKPSLGDSSLLNLCTHSAGVHVRACLCMCAHTHTSLTRAEELKA